MLRLLDSAMSGIHESEVGLKIGKASSGLVQVREGKVFMTPPAFRVQPNKRGARFSQCLFALGLGQGKPLQVS